MAQKKKLKYECIECGHGVRTLNGMYYHLKTQHHIKKDYGLYYDSVTKLPTKKKTVKEQVKKNTDVIIQADLTVQINLTKAIELGIAVVAGEE